MDDLNTYIKALKLYLEQKTVFKYKAIRINDITLRLLQGEFLTQSHQRKAEFFNGIPFVIDDKLNDFEVKFVLYINSEDGESIYDTNP